MGGAQVNAHGDAPLVRVGGLAGFGNLQERHASSLSQLIEVSHDCDVLGKTLDET
jgi:hypothetical protein